MNSMQTTPPIFLERYAELNFAQASASLQRTLERVCRFFLTVGYNFVSYNQLSTETFNSSQLPFTNQTTNGNLTAVENRTMTNEMAVYTQPESMNSQLLRIFWSFFPTIVSGDSTPQDGVRTTSLQAEAQPLSNQGSLHSMIYLSFAVLLIAATGLAYLYATRRPPSTELGGRVTAVDQANRGENSSRTGQGDTANRGENSSRTGQSDTANRSENSSRTGQGNTANHSENSSRTGQGNTANHSENSSRRDVDVVDQAAASTPPTFWERICNLISSIWDSFLRLIHLR